MSSQSADGCEYPGAGAVGRIKAAQTGSGGDYRADSWSLCSPSICSESYHKEDVHWLQLAILSGTLA